MTTFRNDSKGNRGVGLVGGGFAWIAPGETKTIPGQRITTYPSDLVVTDPEPVGEIDLPEPPADLESKLDELPSLSGMNKAELIAQAEIESVDVSAIEGTGANGNVLAGDIRDAIEAKRAA